MRHPQWPELPVEDVPPDERTLMMPNPRPIDGYIEQTLRVSSTSLIHFQRNRYRVPTEYRKTASQYENPRKAARHDRLCAAERPRLFRCPPNHIVGARVDDELSGRGNSAPYKRPNVPMEFKRQLAEQSFEPDASVVLIAARTTSTPICCSSAAVNIPPRQNSCRPDRIYEQGAMMRERVGTIRTSIQG